MTLIELRTESGVKRTEKAGLNNAKFKNIYKHEAARPMA